MKVPPRSPGGKQLSEEPFEKTLAVALTVSLQVADLGGQDRIGVSGSAELRLYNLRSRGLMLFPSGEYAVNGCQGLEMPDHATTDKEVVLAGLARVGQRQIRRAGPEVADLAANTELVPDSNIQAESTLDYARVGGAAGV